MSNIQPYIILNDIDSRTISGLLISSLPPISKPQVRTQVETVDGRDGDLVTPLGFSAYDKVITIGLTYGYDIDDVIEYFNSEGVVVFSNEPDKFYRYAIYEQIDFDKLIRFKKAEVTLHCQPFKFSTTEAPIVRSGSGSSVSVNVVNSGNIYSRPELLLTGSGNATVDLNSSEILSVDLDSANGAIFIDSENMNAYGAKSAINNVIAYINAYQDGEGDPSPNNERTIHGFTECNIYVKSKNLIIEKIPDSNITANGQIQLDNPVYDVYVAPIKKGKTYIMTTGYTGSEAFIYALFYTRPTRGSYGIGNVRYISYITPFTAEFNGYVAFRTPKDYSTPQFELGTIPTTYEAYQGDIYSIDISENPQDPDNPQVVYGGYYESLTGLLTITHGIVDLGTLNWSYVSSKTFFYNTILSGKPTPNYMCDIYKNVGLKGDSDMQNAPDMSMGYVDSLGSLQIKVKNTSYTNAAAFKTAMSGAKLVYELAEPIQIQLAPTQINNLIGLNQVFTDTNGDVAVDYRASGEAHFEQDPIVSFTCTFEDIIKGTLLNRAVTGNYDNIKLNIGLNNLVVNGSGVNQFAIDKYSRWL